MRRTLAAKSENFRESGGISENCIRTGPFSSQLIADRERSHKLRGVMDIQERPPRPPPRSCPDLPRLRTWEKSDRLVIPRAIRVRAFLSPVLSRGVDRRQRGEKSRRRAERWRATSGSCGEERQEFLGSSPIVITIPPASRLPVSTLGTPSALP